MPEDSKLWNQCIDQAKALKYAGINIIWLPPAYKGASGKASVGYDVYDTYDLGEFHQKGTVATKYGNKKNYLRAVRELQSSGIQVLADVVLNHMMGADDKEEVIAQEDNPYNRNESIGDMHTISAWTIFRFQGRHGKYSDFHWNADNFSGIDRDENTNHNGIFHFENKRWSDKTDNENGNFDYLMGANLDMSCPETVKAVTDWGKWYLDTVNPDGLRLDAVKHINFEFYQRWLHEMQQHAGHQLFVVGEYWSGELQKLLNYLEAQQNQISLFDVPLHYKFLNAAQDENFNMGSILDNTLLTTRPENSVTFVDNHDTQPGQALESFIPEWFKPIAYSLILLRDTGIPCVFYGDYYGIPHDSIMPIQTLDVLLRLRKSFAYGHQINYFDDASVVGFTRLGHRKHKNSGLAVLATNSRGGEKRMYVGDKFSNQLFHNVMKETKQTVVIDEDGYGTFFVEDKSAAVWVPEKTFDILREEDAIDDERCIL